MSLFDSDQQALLDQLHQLTSETVFDSFGESSRIFFWSNLSYPVLKNFYQATVQCRPRLLWEKNTQIMLFPEIPNYGMPSMYSESFERFMGGLTPSARTVSELFADSSEYGQEVREQVEG